MNLPLLKIFGVAAIAVCLSSPNAHSTIIRNGEKAIIEFSFDGAPTPLFPSPDLLLFTTAGGALSIESVSYRIYNGETLLGEYIQVGNYSFGGQSFQSASNSYSEWIGKESLTIDFTTIVNGTIDGRIEYEPIFSGDGEVDVNIYFELLTQSGPNSGYINTAPTINNVSVVPEPTSAILILCAFSFALIYKMRRSCVR